MRYPINNPPFPTRSGARPLTPLLPVSGFPLVRSCALQSVPVAAGSARLRRKWLAKLADSPWPSIAAAAGLLLLALLSAPGA